MNTLWEALGVTLQPVVISLATVAVLALLRLMTPAVRWSRQLKHDLDVYSALPPGRERDLWEARAVAQAERLRLFRENRSTGQQFLGWYAIVAILLLVVTSAGEAINGWPLFQSFTLSDWLVAIPLVIAFIFSVVAAVLLSARLVMGLSLIPSHGAGGHYPKYAALVAAERRRQDQRIKVNERLNRVAYEQDKERKERKKAKRQTLKKQV